MEMTVHMQIGDPSAVGAARRRGLELARRIGLDETQAGRAALAVTEAATNVVKHAGGGQILLSANADEDGRALDVLALDRGPGIGNIAEALRDGYSSAGTPGGGLGAIARLASVFDVYSRRGGGTALFVRIGGAAPHAPTLVVAGINVPHPDETVSGDCWAISRRPSGVAILIADGLGHGPLAHEAARMARTAFQADATTPAARMIRIHEALRPTRGAAVAVAEIDAGRSVVRFAGLGNVAGTIIGDGATRSVVSHHGVAGHYVRRIQEFSYPWLPRGVLVLHSDGLLSRWSLDGYPGLIEKHPMLIAGVLYRDFVRGRDDVTVVVAREMS
jgi:anti-sigma regulatory factor (Ser/Thr protein kinase)